MKEVREVAGLPSDMIGYMYYYLAHYDLPEENSEAADGVIEVVIREIARYLSEVQSDEAGVEEATKRTFLNVSEWYHSGDTVLRAKRFKEIREFMMDEKIKTAFADKTPAYIAHGFKSILCARETCNQSSSDLEMYLMLLFDIDNFLSSWHLDRYFSFSLDGFDLDSDVHHGFNT